MGAQAVRLSNGDIDKALKDKEFEVLFQPIFDLGNGALARVETFIRWRHPSLGVLPPGAFISFFETQGRMSELTRYVLAGALSAYAAWRGPFAPGFSINLALSDLSDESFPSHFTVLLREYGFPAELVTLECPMPAVETDIKATARQLQRLADTGARLAIEVRGRANEFLKTIDPFPFTEIKTGGAAILRFARTVRGPGLSAISELLELAAEQNAAITAVGVEDQASLSALRGLGFAAAQGNHLAKVGALSQFLPSHVNDVRALLGLEALSSDDLAALFRTGAPTLAPALATTLAAAPVARATASDDEMAADDDAEVFTGLDAETGDGEESIAPAARDDANDDDELVRRLAARIARKGDKPTQPDAQASEPDAARRAKLKAAAIAKAKRNSVAREKLAARNALAERAVARPDAPAPREMQERLSRAFTPADSEPAYEPNAPFDEMAQAPAAAADHAEDSAPDIAAAPAQPATQTGQIQTGQLPTGQLQTGQLQTGKNETPAAPAVDPAKHMFNARLAVSGAKARFRTPIRVTGAAVDASDIEAMSGRVALASLAATPPAPALRDAPSGDVQQAAARQARTQTPIEAEASDDAIEPIPEPMASAEWLEDIVETDGNEVADAAADEMPATPRGRQRNFLTRTVIPYSALKVTHFWPRAIRRRKNGRAAAE